MMNIASKVLLSSDFLGGQMGLEHNQSTKFQSIAGGIFSLIIVFASSIIGFLFSKDIYERKEPSVIFSREPIKSSEITLNEYPLAVYMFYNTLGFRDSTYSYIYVDIAKVDISPEGVVNRTIYSDVIEKCNISTMVFPEDSNHTMSSFSFVEGPGYMCFKNPERFNFRNNFGTPDSTYLNFRFSHCKPGSPSCPDNISDLVSSVFIGFAYVNSYVDSSNYESPVYYKVETTAIQPAFGLLKRQFIRTVSSIYTSDNGFLLTNKIDTNSYMIDSTAFDIVAQSKDFPNHVLWVTYESPSIRYKYMRSYRKIQDFLASVGGFANALRIIFMMLTKPLLRFLYLKFIGDLIMKDTLLENKLKVVGGGQNNELPPCNNRTNDTAQQVIPKSDPIIKSTTVNMGLPINAVRNNFMTLDHVKFMK